MPILNWQEAARHFRHLHLLLPCEVSAPHVHCAALELIQDEQEATRGTWHRY